MFAELFAKIGSFLKEVFLYKILLSALLIMGTVKEMKKISGTNVYVPSDVLVIKKNNLIKVVSL